MLLALTIGLAAGQPETAPYVAHEWGTFTTLAGQDGVALEWRPLEQESDLPSFVYTLEDIETEGRRNLGPCVNKGCSGRVRMETPVIYFHAEEPLEVRARVRFTEGSVTEWYPHASATFTQGVDWGRIRIDPTAEPELPHEGAPSHYYPARQVDSAPVSVCDTDGTEWEQFLFYRGVGQAAPALRASLVEDEVRIEGSDEPVWLFVNDGQDVMWSYGTERVLELPTGGDLEELKVALRDAAVDRGLYVDEADAMLATWDDTWFEEGTRLFYLLPDAEVRRMLPLQLDPRPTELSRVLVGRVELAGPLVESVSIGADSGN